MQWLRTMAAGLVLVLGAPASATGAEEAGMQEAAAFEAAKVHFEQNATDEDAEFVFEVVGGDAGLLKLQVVAPDGRTVFDFTAPDASTLGFRHFHFESPEPGDIAGLKAAYPEGVYRFSGVLADGQALASTAQLNHRLPETTSILPPVPLSANLLDLRMGWTPVANLVGYLVEIEQEETGVSFKASLPPTVTDLAAPAGFLMPDTEYKMSVGTVTADGNISFVESTFTTPE